MRRRSIAALAVAILGVTVALGAGSAPAGAEPADSPGQYEVLGVRTLAQRNAIARTGVAIDGIEHRIATVTATNAEVTALRRLGFTVEPVLSTLDFPPSDSAYHNYAEMVAEVNQVVAAYPSIASKRVIGKTYENRDI